MYKIPHMESIANLITLKNIYTITGQFLILQVILQNNSNLYEESSMYFTG